MKGGWLAGEFRMRHTGQTEVFWDSKAHVSCSTPFSKIEKNSVKLKCLKSFIYFTFMRWKSKLDLELIA